jgi:hypothetical protein
VDKRERRGPPLAPPQRARGGRGGRDGRGLLGRRRPVLAWEGRLGLPQRPLDDEQALVGSGRAGGCTGGDSDTVARRVSSGVVSATLVRRCEREIFFFVCSDELL